MTALDLEEVNDDPSSCKVAKEITDDFNDGKGIFSEESKATVSENNTLSGEIQSLEQPGDKKSAEVQISEPLKQYMIDPALQGRMNRLKSYGRY